MTAEKIHAHARACFFWGCLYFLPCQRPCARAKL